MEVLIKVDGNSQPDELSGNSIHTPQDIALNPHVDTIEPQGYA